MVVFKVGYFVARSDNDKGQKSKPSLFLERKGPDLSAVVKVGALTTARSRGKREQGRCSSAIITGELSTLCNCLPCLLCFLPLFLQFYRKMSSALISPETKGVRQPSLSCPHNLLCT